MLEMEQQIMLGEERKDGVERVVGVGESEGNECGGEDDDVEQGGERSQSRRVIDCGGGGDTIEL